MIGGWTRLDTWTRSWLVASVVYAAALLVAAYALPVYRGSAPQTLVQVNGGKVILIVAVPLVGALLAIGTIVVRLGHARDGVGVFTWLVLGVLGAFTLLGILTIGVFVAPVTVCLLIATLRIQEAARAS